MDKQNFTLSGRGGKRTGAGRPKKPKELQAKKQL